MDFGNRYPTEKNEIIFGHHITDGIDIAFHLHDNYEIFQACSDNIRYFVEGTVYHLEIGDIIITNSKELHRPQITNNEPYDRRYIQFGLLPLTLLFDSDYNPLRIFESRQPGVSNRLPIGRSDKCINDLFDHMENLNNNPTPSNRLYQKTLLIELLIHINLQYENINKISDDSSSMDNRIIPVLRYLTLHYDQPITLDDLAKYFFIDKYYLSHLFKKNTGFTIFDYIQSKRIQYAKELIQQGVSISEASQQCGFNDYTNFYKAYKKLTGQSPAEYKRSISI